jgi:uncharacterized protein (DUF58 family)
MEPSLSGGWRPTAPLVRSIVTAAVLALAALVLGRPDLVVLAAPFGLMAALGLAHAPGGPPTGRVQVTDRRLHEGQATRLLVSMEAPDALEQVTATLSPSAYVLVRPPSGANSGTPTTDGGSLVELAVSSRRWGVRPAGTVTVAATTPWSGYRWGPQRLPDATLVTLPEARRFASAETSHPVGLIGQNRSRRGGAGSEFFSVRPFQPGDRLRRVNWRTTLRTGELHAVGTRAEEDSAILILLDAVTDVGASGGIDGDASSLDVTVRAASALAAHHAQVGDRVALRVLGRTGQVLGPGSGLRHQRRLQELLAQVEPGRPELLGTRELRLRTGAGTIVVVLSPLLTPEISTVMMTLARRGLSVVCVDTLGEGTLPEPARDPHSASRLAWRMRMLEREMQRTEVTRRGIPVVPWRGRGTLDEVLRGLAQRTRLPRTPSR